MKLIKRNLPGAVSCLYVLLALQNFMTNLMAKNVAPQPTDGSKHPKEKPHQNAKQPLSFWESRDIYNKSNDKSEAKMYIMLIALFGTLLICVLICIGIICWRESAREKEDAENQQLQHQMKIYENDYAATGQDMTKQMQMQMQSNDPKDSNYGSNFNQEGGQFSHRSMQSLSPRQRSSSFVKTNLQDGYISGKQLKDMTVAPVPKLVEQRDVSPKSLSAASVELGEQRRPSFLKMWGTSTEMTTLKNQQSLDSADGGLSTHQSSKQNIFGSSGAPSNANEAKQRQTSHFGVIKEEEENSINNSEAQSKSKQFKGYQVLANEEQRTGVDIESQENY